LLAAVTGQVSVRIATARETHELTGHSAGEVPPFGHGRDVRIVMDRDLSSRQWVWASAGTSHAHLHITPRTLRMLANAVVAPLAQRPGTRDLERTAPMLSLGARAGAVAGAGA
jgi:prolyl-tRNA editing enzyme YbaK/EbsC (Cys-tRNA(Pro) deacylase)